MASVTESRKRARTEDGEGARAKKRALTEERNSPTIPNGTTTTSTDADEPKDADSLETFRKDAIYRRMKHYSRENERSQARISELESQRQTCEAGLAALNACWSQVVDTIRSLVRPEDLPPVDARTEEIYDLSTHVSDDPDPAYVESLRGKMQATQQLITAFVQLGGKAQALLSQDEMYAQCQKAQTQYSSLRSEVSLVRAQLKSSEIEKERLHEKLLAAESRMDRLQSKAVSALYAPSKQANSPGSAAAEGGGTKEGEQQVKDGASPHPTPSSPSPDSAHAGAGGVNGIHKEGSGDMQIVNEEPDSGEGWKAVAEVREKRIEELQQQTIDLRGEIHQLRATIKVPPEQIIRESPHYKVLYHITQEYFTNEETRQKELQSCRDEVDQLIRVRQEWQEELTSQHDKALQELRAVIQSRDTNLTRIREQRDQLTSELNERKQKDSVKLASLNEWKTLAESREERINVLTSEVIRLKARLATSAGDEDLMKFLFQNGAIDQSYVDDLRKRLSTAESRATALESSLSRLSESHPIVATHIRSEAEARQELAQLKRRVEAFESEGSDVHSLREQVKLLKQQEKEREQAELTLCTELEKLSSASDTLDRQMKSKIFDLSAMEERVVKAGLDRAKLENKFYSAMRDKEAIDNERKNLLRNVDKQASMVEKLVDSERNLSTRVLQFEREVPALKKANDHLKSLLETKDHETKDLKSRLDNERKTFELVRQYYDDHDRESDKRHATVRKDAEAVARQKAEAERLMSRAKAAAERAEKAQSANASSKEAELKEEVGKCMALLMCSTCKSNMRSTVLTKCMHTFCKPCVESRISSRQRKCPACNVSFSQGEVQNLYLQG